MNQEDFALVPKEILLSDKLSLAAKGVYAVVCTNRMEQRVTLDAIRALIPSAQGLEAAWDELVDFLEEEHRKEMVREAMEELAAAMGEGSEEEAAE